LGALPSACDDVGPVGAAATCCRSSDTIPTGHRLRGLRYGRPSDAARQHGSARATTRSANRPARGRDLILPTHGGFRHCGRFWGGSRAADVRRRAPAIPRARSRQTPIPQDAPKPSGLVISTSRATRRQRSRRTRSRGPRGPRAQGSDRTRAIEPQGDVLVRTRSSPIEGRSDGCSPSVSVSSGAQTSPSPGPRRLAGWRMDVLAANPDGTGLRQLTTGAGNHLMPLG
jgi:hypothetical protein